MSSSRSESRLFCECKWNFYNNSINLFYYKPRETIGEYHVSASQFSQLLESFQVKSTDCLLKIPGVLSPGFWSENQILLLPHPCWMQMLSKCLCVPVRFPGVDPRRKPLITALIYCKRDHRNCPVRHSCDHIHKSLDLNSHKVGEGETSKINSFLVSLF
jgi:hypothetical protein